MGVDQLTGFRDISRDRTIPLPGDILTTPGTVDLLNIPDEIALQPQNVIPFLASQHAKLVDITSRPEIKALSADIPEPDFTRDDVRLQVTALSAEEQGALGEWHEETRMLLTQAAGDPPLDDLDNKIKGYIDEAAKTHPDLYDKGHGGETYDVLGDYFTGQMVQETEESRKKYLEILAAAKGNPEAVILAMTYRNAQRQMSQMGQLLGAYRDKVSALDKLQADMDLKGTKLTQADMLKGNIEFGRNQGDANQIFQIIQKNMNEYERVMISSNSLIKKVDEAEQGIIRNMRS